ncbi:hypothetical protein H5410_056607 [Solanum commersonii]|uniref:Uncharacterized protein n=1 Tax=Solanum commersonii TaxID=4109 RepID=A0A9J5WKP2_SOLCO|nr:hypothetical protein H5410_056607 [Solanum commersonii]
MLLQITYQDKATQTKTEEEDTIEKILKAIIALCTKVDSMDNEIQKLKTNEDNLKSKANGKNPELKGDDGKLLKTHNVCLNTVAGTSQRELANNYLNGNAIWSYYARDQLMIYSNSRELRKSDMDEVQRWILSLLKLE